MRKFIIAAIAALMVPSVSSAEMPDGNITLVVGFRAGGGSDTVARLIAPKLEEMLDRTVIVENRGGAGSKVAAAYVQAQEPDGLTIGFGASSAFTFDPLVADVPFSHEDFSLLSATMAYRNVFIAPVDAPYTNFPEMIDFAKERGWINYASTIPLDRMIMQKIADENEVALNVVPAKGGAAIRQAVLGGHVDIGFSGNSAIRMHEEGALRILATTRAGGLSELPEIPTLKALGYDLEESNYQIWYAPAGLDDTTRGMIVDALQTATSSEEYQTLISDRIKGQAVFLAGDELVGELEANIASNKAIVEALSK